MWSDVEREIERADRDDRRERRHGVAGLLAVPDDLILRSSLVDRVTPAVHNGRHG